MTETETCFHCGAPSVMVREERLSHPDDPDWLDVVMGRASRGAGSGVRVTASACAEHDDALAEAMMDHFGSASGWSLGPLPKDTCPDPFHTTDADDDLGAYAVPVSAPPGFTAIGFRCPTCGFQTMQEMPAHDPADPVYIAARATLDKWLGDPSVR